MAFTKAFDFVVRDILWFKLIKLGIRDKMFNIINPYTIVLNQESNTIILLVTFSRAISELDKGSVCPFLFAMYVNDLEAELAVKGISGIDIGIINLYIYYCMLTTLFFLGKRLKIYKALYWP